MYALLEIERVNFLDNYVMEIVLSTGHHVCYDMKSKLDTIRFLELSEDRIFDNGKVIAGQLIRWDNNIEITLAEILQEINGS